MKNLTFRNGKQPALARALRRCTILRSLLAPNTPACAINALEAISRSLSALARDPDEMDMAPREEEAIQDPVRLLQQLRGDIRQASGIATESWKGRINKQLATLQNALATKVDKRQLPLFS